MESIKTVMVQMRHKETMEGVPPTMALSAMTAVAMRMTMYVMTEVRVLPLTIVTLELTAVTAEREIHVQKHAHHGTPLHTQTMEYVKMEAQTAATAHAIEEQIVSIAVRTKNPASRFTNLRTNGYGGLQIRDDIQQYIAVKSQKKKRYLHVSQFVLYH
jgi:hypothetical protein